MMIEVMTKKEAMIRRAMEGSKYSPARTREEAEAYLADKIGQWPFNDTNGWDSRILLSGSWTQGCRAHFTGSEVIVTYPPEGEDREFPCTSEKEALRILKCEVQQLAAMAASHVGY